MREVVVIGAGAVGVSVALNLRLRGHEVQLVDRGAPGQGTSFGNAGIIQREAVVPYAFPRAPRKLLKALARRGTDISYHAAALPATAGALMRYWWHSAPARHRRIAASYATLVAPSLEEHGRLVALAGADELIVREGWLDACRSPRTLAESAAQAAASARDFGIESRVLDAAGLARLEPHLAEPMAGAIHWRDTWTVRDPGGLVLAWARAFSGLGGSLSRGEVSGLRRKGAGWRVEIAGGPPLRAEAVVIAAGPWSAGLTRALGYRLPLFVKRGYHMHYAADPKRPLRNWLADLETGYVLAPMTAGIRLTTGAELALQDAPATPVQLARAEAVARQLFPLGARLDAGPWLGSRPCTADMLPVIGPAPRHAGLWFAFGHGHQGLTLGPVTGRLVAELLGGDAPCIDPRPFAATRFR